MVYVPTTLPRLVKRIPQIQDTKQKSWHTNGKIQAHLHKWDVQNGRKKHRRNRARCPQRIVIGVIAIFKKSWYVRNNYARQIQQQVEQLAATFKERYEQTFDAFADEIKRNHVEKKVTRVSVHKPRCNEAVVLLFLHHSVRVEHPTLKKRRILPGVKTGNAGAYNKRKSN